MICLSHNLILYPASHSIKGTKMGLDEGYTETICTIFTTLFGKSGLVAPKSLKI